MGWKSTKSDVMADLTKTYISSAEKRDGWAVMKSEFWVKSFGYWPTLLLQSINLDS